MNAPIRAAARLCAGRLLITLMTLALAGCYTQLKHAQTDVTAYPAPAGDSGDPGVTADADSAGAPLPHPDCEIFPNPISWSHLMNLHVGQAGAWEDLRVLVRHVADWREQRKVTYWAPKPLFREPPDIRGRATVELLVCVRGEGVRRVMLDLSSPPATPDPSQVVGPYRIIPLQLVPVRLRQVGTGREPDQLGEPVPEASSIVGLCIQRVDIPQPCGDINGPNN